MIEFPTRILLSINCTWTRSSVCIFFLHFHLRLFQLLIFPTHSVLSLLVLRSLHKPCHHCWKSSYNIALQKLIIFQSSKGRPKEREKKILKPNSLNQPGDSIRPPNHYIVSHQLFIIILLFRMNLERYIASVSVQMSTLDVAMLPMLPMSLLLTIQCIRIAYLDITPHIFTQIFNNILYMK